MTSYEQNKRMSWMQDVRAKALESGVTLRPSAPGLAAMAGYGEDGSVWVWEELTKSLTQVAPTGAVDVSTIPEYKPRGRTRVQEPLVVKPLGFDF